MMLSHKKETRSPLRAAFLCLILTGISVFHVLQFWAEPTFSLSGNKQGNVLIQLSLADSAVGQAEKRPSTFSSKSDKQNLTPSLPAPRRAFWLMESGARVQATAYPKPAYSAILHSPPSDRAPPFA
jgi:hypothetical protein